MENMTPLLVGTAEAAKILNMSKSHLDKLRYFKRPGPPYIQLGRSVRYSPEALRKWVVKNTVSD